MYVYVCRLIEFLQVVVCYVELVLSIRFEGRRL